MKFIRKSLGLKGKIIAVGVVGALLPVLVISMIIAVQSASTTDTVTDEMDKLTADATASISKDVYEMCETANLLVQDKVSADLNVSRDVLNNAGGATISTEETVTWDTVNQYTKEVTTVELPKMLVGGQWLGQNSSFSVETPVVDKTKDMVGGTCTIFQRLNEAGDILRVATNVEKLDGMRAIGTYIPAINPDGTANPVVSTVMRGETYRGRAYVVNAWYITAYEPIRNSSGEIVGVLYVGVKQEAVEALREAIMDIQVGKTGYVYVIGGSGDIQGDYIISKDGVRDGENIWEAQDADGSLFIQNIVNKGVALREGEVAYERYPWMNKGESQARYKTAAITYFAPWDWVIGAGAYEDDFQDATDTVHSAMNSLLIWTIVGGLITLALVIVMALVIANLIIAPVKKLTLAADKISTGELDVDIDVKSRDEVGDLANGFGRMVASMKFMMEEDEPAPNDAFSDEVKSALE